MRRVVLLSQHYYGSRRRTGFHNIADAFAALGWDVTFATVALSHLSRLVRDHRFAYPVRAEAGRIVTVRRHVHSYVLYTPFHPANARSALLNRMAAPLWRQYGRVRLGPLAEQLKAADLIVFESNPGLVLFDRVRALNPTARIVYRVSDDIRLLRNHPVVIAAEQRAAPAFDLVSVPIASMAALFPAGTKVAVHPHGVDARLLVRDEASPYLGTGPQAVFAGVARFDHTFLELALRETEDWHFHIFGPIHGLPSSGRVHAYGEVPFDRLIRYLQHADAGLHTLAYEPGAEVFAESLKVQQYAACRLPIIAPKFLGGGRPNVVTYTPGDAISIRDALACARKLDRSTLPGDSQSWEDVARALAGEGSTDGV